MYCYQEYTPDIRLSPWVKNYWFANDFVATAITPKVFPDGCTDIIFQIDRAKGTSLTTLFGTMTAYVEVDMPKSSQMFGIRFKPAGISAFTNIPLDMLTNQSIELALLESLFDESFYEVLPEKQSVQEIITHTNSFLAGQLPRLYSIDGSVCHAISLISNRRGQLNLADLASEICLSQRHFERRFKSTIGISPKGFARIIRFKYALQSLIRHPQFNLSTIAEECGYYDLTHLANDFKSITGDTPTSFRKEKSNFYAYDKDYK